ncbi:MAG: acyl-CoA thioesterase [Magnetospirillum gryphiswaldense]|uniref:acyl-CoA thioesterase n=1 Tax=Magnetospirillum sp. 64-120 TaxID=1895778 RepID=UPI000925D980|nr:thioesterase family protein [Magnetospirillum sp. 64-120]MBI2241860.1 acyl-CoA thioesterase [Magnetospirillum gryphiswaldense]OJX80878.1 MAG: thioesterase [Magnetospirillum sp. 64-120]
MSRAPAPRRQDFPYVTTIQTRWSDNDMFGHINNVEYYRFFEMVVVDFLRGPCAMDIMTGPVMTFAAESRCSFRRPLSWPEPVSGGLRIEHVGNSSVRYGIALFGETSEEAAADGHWTHVFVERATQRPTPIPAFIRDAFLRHQG